MLHIMYKLIAIYSQGLGEIFQENLKYFNLNNVLELIQSNVE